MNVFKISGTITYTWFPPEEEEDEQDIVSLSEYDSVFDGIDKTWRVSQIVAAENREAALAKLRTIPGALPDDYVDDEDLDCLKVEHAPPAVTMRALGVPTLFEEEVASSTTPGINAGAWT